MKVIIENFNDTFEIYNSAGQCLEADFETYDEAQEYAKQNGMTVVNSFNTKHSADLLFISIRTVLAESESEAIEKVESGEFYESHDICDKVLPLNEETLEMFRKYIKSC